MTIASGSSMAHVIGAEGLVVINLRDGEIRLRGVDGDTVRIRDVNGQDLSDVFQIEAEEGSVSLKATRGFEFILGSRTYRRGFGRQSAELDVELPMRANVVIETERAEIQAANLAGEQRYQNASGDIELRSVSGRITVDVVSGDFEMSSGGDTALAIRSVSGDVEVEGGTLLALEAQTTSGDLEVTGRFAGPGPFAIETVSGDARIAPAGPIRVEMASLTGDLTTDAEGAEMSKRGNRSITIGSGGPTVTFRSMSGDIHVGHAVASEPPGAVRPPTPPAPPSPIAPTPPAPPHAPNGAIAAAYEEARLRILRSLERGEIDVVEAGRRLETLDAGDPEATAEASDAVEGAASRTDRTDD